MDRQVASKYADVITAFAAGATIQCKPVDDQTWRDTVSPSFIAGFEYRVKPAAPVKPLLEPAVIDYEIQKLKLEASSIQTRLGWLIEGMPTGESQGHVISALGEIKEVLWSLAIAERERQ